MGAGGILHLSPGDGSLGGHEVVVVVDVVVVGVVVEVVVLLVVLVVVEDSVKVGVIILVFGKYSNQSHLVTYLILHFSAKCNQIPKCN